MSLFLKQNVDKNLCKSQVSEVLNNIDETVSVEISTPADGNSCAMSNKEIDSNKFHHYMNDLEDARSEEILDSHDEIDSDEFSRDNSSDHGNYFIFYSKFY